jgi:hypothetical protein
VRFKIRLGMVSDLEVCKERGRVGDDAGVSGDVKDDKTSRVSKPRWAAGVMGKE